MKKVVIVLVVTVLIGIVIYVNSGSLLSNLVNDINIEEINFGSLSAKNNGYYYNKLNEDEKQYYRIIADGILDLKTSIILRVSKKDDYMQNKKDIEKTLNALFADHPEIFYVENTYQIKQINIIGVKVLKIDLKYVSTDKLKITAMEKAMEEEVDAITSKLINCKNDYEKELLIHDLIATNVTYYKYDNYNNIPAVKHTAYGALVDRSAVCDGLTKAFQIVLNKNNIENIFVSGYSDNVAHAWCKIKLDNEYYNTDLTSDKVLNTKDKSLVIHSYFNITDKQILQTHVFDNSDDLPSCMATKYNYYIYNDYTVSYFDNISFKMKNIIEKQSSKSLLEVAFNGVNDVPNKLMNALYDLNFNNYKTNKVNRIEYNNIYNTYIIVK